MLNRREKVDYFLSCALKLLDPKSRCCPSCGGRRTTLLEEKYVVSMLRRCDSCSLCFRAPTTSAKDTNAFYQDGYRSGMTTTLPTKMELDELKASNFKCSEKDISRYLRVIELVRPFDGCLIFEFGASWGYGTWQLKKAGYSVIGYEVSHERAKYGRELLGLDILEDLPEAKEQFDIIFSIHVMEHVPSVRSSVKELTERLKPGGILIIFTPNGCEARKGRDLKGWRKSWGAVHPNLLTDEYYKKQFSGWQLLLASSPYQEDELRSRKCGDKPLQVLDLSGDELLAVAKKPAC